jgi:2'-5' RNA ligase
MPVVVQLDLDEIAASSIDRISARLETYPKVETVRQVGDVPHLSLAIYDDLPEPRFVNDVALFTESIPPLAAKLANIGIFTGSSAVVFFGIVVTEHLLEVHRRFHRAVARYNDACWEHYRPGAWVPHVTLATSVSPKVLPECLATVAAHWEPMDIRLDSIRVIRFRPVETILLRNLSPAA